MGKDINARLKEASEGKYIDSDLHDDSQWSRTRFFTSDLIAGFVYGKKSACQEDGEGRKEYTTS